MRSAAAALARRLVAGDAAGAGAAGAALLAPGTACAWRSVALANPLSTRCLSSTSTPAAASTSDDQAGPAPKAAWLPAWARARLPAVLGGDPGDVELTLDAWATQIKRARQLAAAGHAIGGAARASADPQAQGSLRLYESVIAAMQPAHRADPASFDGPARAAVAEAAGASRAQVDDCMAKFEWTRQMMRLLAERRASGQAMPASVEDLEAMMGDWRARRRGLGGGGGGGGVAAGACPFEGRAAPPGRNAVCGRTGKKWKNCCGGV